MKGRRRRYSTSSRRAWHAGCAAQLVSQGLLGGTLHVNFAEVPDAPPATFERSALEVPIVPSAPSEGGDLIAAATELAQSVAALPLDEVVSSAATLLGNVNSLVTDERVRAAPENLGLLLADIRRLVEGDAVQQAPAELAALLASAREVIDDLAQRQVAADLATTLQAATRTLESVGTAADGLPASVDGVVGELRPLLADLRAGGAVDNVNATLASVRRITDEIAAAELAESLRTTVAAVESAVGNIGTASEGLPELLASLTALSRKAEALPLDQMVASATKALDEAERLLASEEVAQVPVEVSAALSELRTNLATLREGGAMENASATLAALRQVTDEIAAAELAERLGAVLARVQGAVGNVDSAAAGLPPLLDSLTALAEDARGLPLNELVASAARTVASAEALIASEAVGEVPQAVNLALAELRLILADVRDGEAVQNASASLASVRALTEEMAAAELADSLRSTLAAVETAVTNVDTAAQDLPQVLANLRRLSEQASDLPLEDLVASGRKVLESADRLLASEGMAAVPPRLAAALDQLRLVLSELREGGAVQNLNASLASADEAAAAVAAAANTLPALAAQLSQAAVRAEQALASFGPNSDINRDTLLLLRELRDTAKSVNSLVVQLERRPNSVLFGR